MRHEKFDRRKSGLILVGCGNMGFSLLQSWLTTGAMAASEIDVVETSAVLRERVDHTSVRMHENIDDLDSARAPEVVVFAVKPQVLPVILPLYRRYANGAVFVSIAAGVSISALREGLGNAAIVRAMPNTPVAIGQGSTVFCCGGTVTPNQASEVERLLAAGGSAHRVAEESLIDMATAISGSGPAYVFHFIEVLAAAGAKLGLPDALALDLAKDTVSGAGALAASREAPPEELRREVTSPNGTTAAALSVLTENHALAALVENAVSAAHRRAVELADLAVRSSTDG